MMPRLNATLKSISTAEEHEAAKLRAKSLEDSQGGTRQAAELAELIAAIRKWDEAQEALDVRSSGIIEPKTR